LHAEGGPAQFDRTNGIFTPDLLVSLQATHPEPWERLNKTHGAALP